MGMTITEKILAKSAGLDSVKPGDLIFCALDMVLGNDVTAPVAIKEFYKMGASNVFDKNKIALVPDHFTPNKDIKSAELAKTMREFAHKMEITNYFEVGRAGIEHALLPEKGLVKAGDVIIGADSHTCTYGALGAFSTGIGSTDMACGMATGKCWFRVPETIRVVFDGELNRFVTGKDVILTLIKKLGVGGARYKALEFSGNISALPLDGRFTIANMAVEAGAKNGIFETDDEALAYIRERAGDIGMPVKADADAVYCEIINLNLSEIVPVVACPHLPENTVPVIDCGKIPINQVVIGSCTNGRMGDMRAAAEILKGKKVADNVRLIVIPATQEIWLNCVKEGLAEIFVNAGASFCTPTCGPCLGGHTGILAAGEICVSTTNRNFVGRMGHTESKVFLASPFVAAESAIRGYIAAPGNAE